VKKAIDWFALVVGVALALLGARWMWTGWDIVQAERGWTAVIAGSVMLSGGLVVAMLAWTVMRLTDAAVGSRSAEPDTRAAPRGASKVSKTAIAAAAPVVAGAGVLAGAAVAGAERARHAADEVEEPASPPESLGGPPPVPPSAPPTVGELLRMSEDRVARESHEKTFESPEAIVAPLDAPVDLAAEPPVVDAPVETLRESEPDLAMAKAAIVEAAIVDLPAPAEPPPHEPVSDETLPDEPARDAPETPKAASEPLRIPDPPSPPVASAEEPEYDDWLERTAREFDRELGRDHAPKDEPPPEPPPAPPKPEPAVVGRYSSGDTNYLMFADGSIEAQTPEGVMRFASLTELKRFVEKRD